MIAVLVQVLGLGVYIGIQIVRFRAEGSGPLG